MKFIKGFLIVLASLLIASCSDDDDKKDNLELSSDYLNQSSWTGKLTGKKKNGEVDYEYVMGILFSSKTEGKYDISRPLDPQDSFTYSIDKRRLSIADHYNNIGKEWFVEYKSEDSLVLVHNKDISSTTDYMYLKRTY